MPGLSRKITPIDLPEKDVQRIRKECGRKFLIVTPGIRPPRGAMDDQKRIMTPEAAVRAGANYLVVGSPIRDAADPVAAARAIVAAMERGAGMLAAGEHA